MVTRAQQRILMQTNERHIKFYSHTKQAVKTWFRGFLRNIWKSLHLRKKC